MGHFMGESWRSRSLDVLKLPNQASASHWDIDGCAEGTKPTAMMFRWDDQYVTNGDKRRELLDVNSLGRGPSTNLVNTNSNLIDGINH